MACNAGKDGTVDALRRYDLSGLFHLRLDAVVASRPKHHHGSHAPYGPALLVDEAVTRENK